MSGLLNGLQAASNTVAGNVSGPVDLLALLLRKAGVPVGDAPVGGSAWMAQRGLTAPVQQGASQVVGDTLGLLGPKMLRKHGVFGIRYLDGVSRAQQGGGATSNYVVFPGNEGLLTILSRNGVAL